MKFVEATPLFLQYTHTQSWTRTLGSFESYISSRILCTSNSQFFEIIKHGFIMRGPRLLQLTDAEKASEENVGTADYVRVIWRVRWQCSQSMCPHEQEEKGCEFGFHQEVAQVSKYSESVHGYQVHQLIICNCFLILTRCL